MRNKALHFVVDCAIFTALALVLDLIAGPISDAIWPEGGSISICMVPIFMMGIKYGPKGGFLTGLLVGSIQILWAGSGAVYPVQVILDYVLAYTLCGVSSLFWKLIRTENISLRYLWICLGILAGCFLRTICSTISGVVYWETPLWASFTYNASYIAISMVLCMLLTCVLDTMLVKFNREENN